MYNKALLDSILKTYNVSLKNTKSMYLAMTHSSYANETKSKFGSNERIEFLGDAVLQLLVTEYLYNTFPDMSEGVMSKTRSAYVCEEANAGYAYVLKLEQLLMLGRGEELSGGRKRPAILADAFESFLGAVYLEGGLEEVKKILNVVVFPHILVQDEQPFIDYKSRLQEYIQAESRTAVKYVLDKEEGPNHKPTFTMSVFYEEHRLGTGVGHNKSEATQAAAKAALEKMAKL